VGVSWIDFPGRVELAAGGRVHTVPDHLGGPRLPERPAIPPNLIVPLAGVRRWLQAEAVLPQAGDATALAKLPKLVRDLLLGAPATVA
jgi:hypothetical protein